MNRATERQVAKVLNEVLVQTEKTLPWSFITEKRRALRIKQARMLIDKFIIAHKKGENLVATKRRDSVM